MHLPEKMNSEFTRSLNTAFKKPFEFIGVLSAMLKHPMILIAMFKHLTNS